MKDERLGHLLSYTIFHIGVYVTLISALLGSLLTDHVEPWLAIPTIVCFTLAGICGAVVGSNIPDFKSFEEFEAGPLTRARWFGKIPDKEQVWNEVAGRVEQALNAQREAEAARVKAADAKPKEGDDSKAASELEKQAKERETAAADLKATALKAIQSAASKLCKTVEGAPLPGGYRSYAAWEHRWFWLGFVILIAGGISISCFNHKPKVEKVKVVSLPLDSAVKDIHESLAEMTKAVNDGMIGLKTVGSQGAADMRSLQATLKAMAASLAQISTKLEGADVKRIHPELEAIAKELKRLAAESKSTTDGKTEAAK